MSLYNLLCGKNPSTFLILALLGLKENDIERFRDCDIDFDEEEIHILARTGGGNREDYPNDVITSHPCYKHDEDDDFDCTYAHYYLRFPPEVMDISELANIEENGIPASVIQAIRKVEDRPETKGDIYTKNRRIQQEKFDELLRYRHVMRENGWIWIPLTDHGMEGMLGVIERTGGEILGDIISIPKLRILVDSPLYGKSSTEQCRAFISPDRVNGNWEPDIEARKRYVELFKEKYPKSIHNLES